MQGGRDSFPEPIDLNQGSIPRNTSSSWDNMLNPVENQLSNYMLGPVDGNRESSNDSDDDTCHNFSGWARGESSSAANNTQGVEDSKPNLRWPSSLFTSCYGHGPDSENWSFDPPSDTETAGNESLSMQNYRASSSNNIGAFTSSLTASEENHSSCKRKAVEGTSEQFYPPGGSSPSNQNTMHHHHSRGNLIISSSPSLNNFSEELNPRNNGVDMSNQSLPFFLSSSGLGETEARNPNPSSRSNHGRQDHVLFETPRGISSSRNSGVYSSPVTTNPNSTVTEARGGIYPYSRNEPPFTATEEAPATNATRGQIDWSFTPGNLNRLSPRNHSSSSLRVGPSSSSSAWLRHRHNLNRQRLLEGSGPSVPLHGTGTESGIRRSNYVAHLASSSSSEELGPNRRGQRRMDQRSAAGFLMDELGEDIDGSSSLAAIEARHRLIRQVFTAMRRGVHLQAEEYMLVDPLMNEFAELHDRHRDMRLDVDNMSYEELLALEDRIGSVSTGLSEDQIRSSIKQRKFESFFVLPNLEPCCICQENYISGDDIGILDCGHEFHTGCVKQWLTLKNICPICKMTGLET